MRSPITWLMALTLLASPSLSYGANSPGSINNEELQLRNVELTAAHSLQGQLVDGAGQVVANAKVRVRSQDNIQQVSQQIVTDEDGRFEVAGLKSGTCVVEAADQVYAVRVWKKGTAPPKSLQNVSLVTEQGPAVRGQLTNNRFVNFIRGMTPKQKVCLGVLVAAAIVLPIALDDDGS